MSETSMPESAAVIQRLRGLTAEVGQAVRLRRDLAELEIRHDCRNARRLAIVGGTGAVFTLIAIPVLLVAAAFRLANNQVSAVEWMLIIGLALLIPGLAIIVTAYRKFRAEFCGLRSTLAELNEDLVWLREWTERADSTGDRDAQA